MGASDGPLCNGGGPQTLLTRSRTKLQRMAVEARARSPHLEASLDALVRSIDLDRLRLSTALDPVDRAEFGQYLTPAPVAQQLAAMLTPLHGEVRILDPGAGIGSLAAALIRQLLRQEQLPSGIVLEAYEVADAMMPGLHRTIEACDQLCEHAGVDFHVTVHREDFLAAGAAAAQSGLFGPRIGPIDAAIINPPYRKIAMRSMERGLCRQIGLETTNLYTAFLAVAAALLASDGQMAAIVPRSFANGTYFRPFRDWFTKLMAFTRFHVYDSRKHAFADDDVLQENVLFSATKTQSPPATVTLTSSADPSADDATLRDVPYSELISPTDPLKVIHLIPDEVNHRVAQRVASLACDLDALGLAVSTGRVVDFRATEFVRRDAQSGTVPLIYPGHLRAGQVQWPMASGKKPNALLQTRESQELMVPEGLYVLTKRFSSKEERRRVVAALYDPANVRGGPVGFENHLNYFHRDGSGLSRDEALGLRAFLNSTLVDLYFRQFSGHTQVNAGDLRRLRYPSGGQLQRLASRAGAADIGQEALDRIVDEELFAVTGQEGDDPVRTNQRVNEAVQILRALDFPRGQLNERSGLTLLALLGLAPNQDWAEASDPLMGITPMMDFFRTQYGKEYAPNTRETVRRSTVHQFVEDGLVITNPDEPKRPTNSPLSVYQIEPSGLELIRTYGTAEWEQSLEAYLASRETLRQRYAAERAMSRLPLTLPDGTEFTLSGGGQNVLVAEIINSFCPRWAGGGIVLYVGDTDEKFAHIDTEELERLGIVVEEHGKMPDVIVYDRENEWLLLIEAVTSHGPVDGKRRLELQRLFSSSTAPVIYVTAFLDRRAMVKYLPDIAWETEVWCASDPTHMIHFNGPRYLGPYD